MTEPWENAIEEANERKRFLYAEMAVDPQQKRQKALVRLVEICDMQLDLQCYNVPFWMHVR